MSESDLEEFYTARANSEMEKMLSFVHQQCEFRIVGSAALAPFTQSTKGGAVRAVATKLVDDWDLSGVKNVSIDRVGDTVYVHREGEIVYRPDGSKLQTEFMDKLTFKNGKIIEYLQFFDTFAIAKILGF